MRGGVTFIFVFLGAAFFWIVKGLKTKFSDEFSGIQDTDYKFYRNLIVGMAIIVFFTFIVVSIFNNG